MCSVPLPGLNKSMQGTSFLCLKSNTVYITYYGAFTQRDISLKSILQSFMSNKNTFLRKTLNESREKLETHSTFWVKEQNLYFCILSEYPLSWAFPGLLVLLDFPYRNKALSWKMKPQLSNHFFIPHDGARRIGIFTHPIYCKVRK